MCSSQLQLTTAEWEAGSHRKELGLGCASNTSIALPGHAGESGNTTCEEVFFCLLVLKGSKKIFLPSCHLKIIFVF